MSVWGSWKRGIRPSDATWMPEEVELAPDWLRDELLESPEELKNWLTSQVAFGTGQRPAKRGRGGRRGRKPKQQ